MGRGFRGGTLTQAQHALPVRLVVLPVALVDVAVVVVHASPPAALVATPLTLVILLGSEKLDPIALKAGRCPTICQVSHLSLLLSPAFLAEGQRILAAYFSSFRAPPSYRPHNFSSLVPLISGPTSIHRPYSHQKDILYRVGAIAHPTRIAFRLYSAVYSET